MIQNQNFYILSALWICIALNPKKAEKNFANRSFLQDFKRMAEKFYFSLEQWGKGKMIQQISCINILLCNDIQERIVYTILSHIRAIETMLSSHNRKAAVKLVVKHQR